MNEITSKSKSKSKKIKLRQIQDMKYSYLDIERWPEEESKIFSIQTAETSFSDLMNNNPPEIIVYGIWDYASEKELLKDFQKTYERYLLGQQSKRKLVVFGYFLDKDFKYLNDKLNDCELISEDKKEKIYNLRIIDLLPLSRSSTGILDPSLATTIKYLDLKQDKDEKGGNRIKNLKMQILKDEDDSKELFLEYIKKEFLEIFKLFKFYFGKDYVSIRSQKQKKLVKLQNWKSTKKYFQKIIGN